VDDLDLHSLPSTSDGVLNTTSIPPWCMSQTSIFQTFSPSMSAVRIRL